MWGREPAIVIAALVAIIQGVWIFITADATVDVSMLSVLLAPLVGGWLTRRNVIPTETVREAGISPEAVQARADNPSIPKHVGP